MCGNGNESRGRVKDTFAQGSPALEEESVDRWLTLPTDSLRHRFLSLGSGSRPDGNSRTARDGVLCDWDDAILLGDETKIRMANQASNCEKLAQRS